MSDGYTKYLEERLALAEAALRDSGRSFSMPETPFLRDLQRIDVGRTIEWQRRYPRGDVYNFVAFLQKPNEWHMVSGKSKHIKTHEELATNYLAHALNGRVVILGQHSRLVR